MTINTLEGYVKLKEFYQDSVIPIFIYASDDVRLERALKREKKQKEPKYAEMCRRFVADSEDFSDENIKNTGITNLYINDNELIDNVVDKIKIKISEELGYKKQKTRKL